MSSIARSLGLAAIGLAMLDWGFANAGARAARLATKPGVIAALIGLALTLAPVSAPARALVVAGLALGLAGDVLLLLSDRLFTIGLVAFLLGHLCYLGAFALLGRHWVGGAAGVVVVLVVAGALLPSLLGGLRASGREALVGPVVAYLVGIGAMVVAAAASGRLLVTAGALLFLASDAILAVQRFVRPVRHGDVTNLVTYHAGQALIVLGLAFPPG